MSNEPAVMLRLDTDCRAYRPGDTLSGDYWCESLGAGLVKAIEVSVLWHTEGKGDEDIAVHAFWRRNSSDDQPVDPLRPERFSTALPNSPLSYDGQIVKVHWCVRVRVFPYRGKEILGETGFRLGNQAAFGTRAVDRETR